MTIFEGAELLRILVPQLRLAAGHWNCFPLDVDLLDVGFYVERVAVCHDDVGGFADVEGAELVGDAPDFGGVEGDGFEGLVIGKAEGGSESGLIGQVANVMAGVRGEGDFDSTLVELRGKTVDGVVALVFLRSFVNGADDDWHLETGHVVEPGLRVPD